MKGERDVRRRAKFIRAIQTGVTVKQAAKIAGIGATTHRSWVRKGDEELRGILQAHVASRKKTNVAKVVAAIAEPAPPVDLKLGDISPITDDEAQGLQRFSMVVLQNIASDPDQPAAARVAAAKAMCDFTERREMRRKMVGPGAPPPAMLDTEVVQERKKITAAEAAAKWRVIE